MKKIKSEKNKGWKKEFTEQLNESIDYIAEQRKYIYLVTLVFFASAVFGFISSDQLEFLNKFLREIADKTAGLDLLEMIWFIFSNNVTSAVAGLVLGIFFGIFPFFNAIFNGTILGYVYSKAAPIAGYAVIWRLLPHGIFELPAIFISLGLGVHLGMSFFVRARFKTIRQRMNDSLKAFLVIVVPLLALAAIIESFLIFFTG
jgi:stage II sporulation protein M